MNADKSHQDTSEHEQILDQSIEAHRELLRRLTEITELRGENFRLRGEVRRLKECLDRIRPGFEPGSMMEASKVNFQDAERSLS